MAASHEMVSGSVKEIELCVKMLKSSKIIEVTNKRIIIRTPDEYTAKNLAANLKYRGYAYDVKKGNHSSSVYVQAWL